MNYEFIKNESGVPFLELDLNFPHEIAMQEILQIPRDMFTGHRTTMSKNWFQFVIFGQNYNKTHVTWDPNNSNFTHEALKFMPKTVEWFKKFYPSNSLSGIKLALLAPNGKIDKHRDRSKNGKSGLQIGNRSTVNIAVNNPAGAEFFIADTTIPFQAGSCMFIDFGQEHYLTNTSEFDRFHILVGQRDETDEFKHLVEQSYKHKKV